MAEEGSMPQSPYRIMLVDDEREVAETLASTLEALTGHTIKSFSDPYRAVQAFLKEPCHLVLTDVMMPDIDGFELLKMMRAERPSCDCVIITGHKTVEVVSKARRLGAAYIFYKPVDVAALEKVIEELYVRYLYWQARLAEVKAIRDAR